MEVFIIITTAKMAAKSEIRASEANNAFVEYLKTFRVYPQIDQLYLKIMEDVFNTKEGDRELQLTKIEGSMQELNKKLLKIDEMFINGDLEKDSYSRLKKSTQEEENNLQQSYSQLKLADTNFMKYCRYGTSLLKNLDLFYQEARPSVQKKLLGSIFTGKLIFEDGYYRTTELNQAVELIGLFQKELGENKTEHFDISEKTFGKVPRIGLEPTYLTAPEPKSGVSTNFTTWAW